MKLTVIVIYTIFTLGLLVVVAILNCDVDAVTLCKFYSSCHLKLPMFGSRQTKEPSLFWSWAIKNLKATHRLLVELLLISHASVCFEKSHVCSDPKDLTAKAGPG